MDAKVAWAVDLFKKVCQTERLLYRRRELLNSFLTRLTEEEVVEYAKATEEWRKTTYC